MPLRNDTSSESRPVLAAAGSRSRRTVRRRWCRRAGPAARSRLHVELVVVGRRERGRVQPRRAERPWGRDVGRALLEVDRHEVVPRDDGLHAVVALADPADRRAPSEWPAMPTPVRRAVERRGWHARGRSSASPRRLGRSCSSAGTGRRGSAGGVQFGRQQVGVTLPLDVVRHDLVAVLRETLGGPVVEVLVGLDRAVGDDDAGIAAARLAAPTSAAARCARAAARRRATGNFTAIARPPVSCCQRSIDAERVGAREPGISVVTPPCTWLGPSAACSSACAA